jgi:hypothetical protein
MPTLPELYGSRYRLGDDSTCARNCPSLYLESKGCTIDDAEQAMMEKLSRTLCTNGLDKVRRLFPV